MTRYLSVLLTVIGGLWRPIWRRAIFDLAIFTAVSAMGIFFVSLPLKIPVDGIVSLLGAPFERVARLGPGAEARGALVAPVLAGVPVAPSAEYDANRAYTPHLVIADVQVVDDLAAYDRIAAGADLLGGARADGVRLDLDSAVAMAVGIGDEVVILGDPPTLPDLRLRVGGLLRPSPAQADGERLLVVPASLLPAEWLTIVRSATPTGPIESFSTVVFDPKPDENVPAVTRSAAIASRLLELTNPLRIVGYLGLFGFSFGLWVVLLARTFGHVLGSLRARSAILVALGARPSTIALASLIPELAVIAAGIGISAVAVRSVLFEGILRRSLQGAVLLPSLVPVLLILAVSIVIARWTIRRRLRGAEVVRDLTAEEAA